MMFVALVSFVFSVFFGSYYIGRKVLYRRWLSKRVLRTIDSSSNESLFESKGLYGKILADLYRCTLNPKLQSQSLVPVFIEEKLIRKLHYAGISKCSTLTCFNTLVGQKLFQGAIVGALLGSLISLEFTCVFAICGALLSFVLINKALTQEIYLRRLKVQEELPEFLEVLSLGFGAGLNFDASLALYVNHFSTRLASDLMRAQKLWDMGIKTRFEALQELSDSYDFQLLERSFDVIISSLKDGTSLVESLLSLTKQARVEVKIALEERIAKLPIKIMIPTGTLILPAMLLMVMGPVIVEFLETL